MSLKVCAVQCRQRPEGRMDRLILWRHTKNPRWVLRPRYIPDRKKLLVPSENSIHEDCRASRECSELILHDQ